MIGNRFSQSPLTVHWFRLVSRCRLAAPWIFLAGWYIVLAIVTTWPLVQHLSSSLISPLDPLDSVWRLAQGQRQLLHHPEQLLNANIFYPYTRTYLFDELLLGAAVLTLPLQLFTSNPLTIYNLAVLLTFVLSGLSMAALARHLGCGWLGAALAGSSYAFAPFHLDHLPHLGLLSGQYFPLILLLLDRQFLRPRWRESVLLGLLLVWQAVSAQYYALYLVLVVGLFVALRLVQQGWQRQWPPWGVWGRFAVAAVLAIVLVAPIALAYRSVQSEFSFERSLEENILYSANVASFITTDARNLVWGDLTAPLREQGRYTPERNAFPGLIVLLLALVGLFSTWRRWLSQYLALLGLIAAVLALGPVLQLTGDPATRILTRMPYGFLYNHLPGFDSMRVPARFNILYGLAVAALAGLGVQWLWQHLTPRSWLARRWRIAAAYGGMLLLLGGVVGESLNRPYPLTTVPTAATIPTVYQWLATQDRVVALELPLLLSKDRGAELLNNQYQYFAYYHQQPIVNGAGNVAPKGYQALYYEVRDGPTPRALSVLQGLGVTHLLVHYDRMPSAQATTVRTALAQAGNQAVEVRRFGDVAVFAILPTDRFYHLRSLIPPGATIYLSRDDPTGAYGGMLGYVLRANPIYTRVRVDYGQQYAGLPDPNTPYDYAILYRQENPAAVGFGDATVIWEDPTVRVYARNAK